ncbi:MAG TPA: ABC transporter permease [Nitrolancea sp.]|nr:ABC transporter permease [Nitrolancea sp.]
MTPSAARRSITTEAGAAFASWQVLLKERWEHFGRQGYLFIWVVRPIFDLALAALIYAGGRTDLIPYLVVAMTANSAVFNTLYWIGEILDRERRKGTLVMLFLAPCARLSWLLGFAASGIVETAGAALTVGVSGMLLFGVRFDPNLLTLAVTLALFLASLLGLGLILSAAGLLIRKSNELANLVFPAVMLLGGSYYPVSQLPDALRIPARALPMGYGMEALSAAALHHASLSQVRFDLVPLAGFAVVLPLLGWWSFGRIERLVRRRGELDLY